MRSIGTRHESVSDQSTGPQKNDNPRSPYGRVLPGEGEIPGFPVHSEARDCVTPLIARIKEISCRIEIEATRIVAAGPCLSDKRQLSALAYREERNAVVQPVGSVYESAIRRNHDLGGKVCAGENFRQARNSLSRCQRSSACIIVKQRDRGRLLLQRIQPSSV